MKCYFEFNFPSNQIWTGVNRILKYNQSEDGERLNMTWSSLLTRSCSWKLLCKILWPPFCCFIVKEQRCVMNLIFLDTNDKLSTNHGPFLFQNMVLRLSSSYQSGIHFLTALDSGLSMWLIPIRGMWEEILSPVCWPLREAKAPELVESKGRNFLNDSIEENSPTIRTIHID